MIQVPAAKHSDRIRQALTGRQSAAVITTDIPVALAAADAYAAEHLEIHTRDAAADAAAIRNAGAIFGPVQSGVPGRLPGGFQPCCPRPDARATQRSERHDFSRSVQVVEYDQPALMALTDQIQALALAEDLLACTSCDHQGGAVSDPLPRPELVGRAARTARRRSTCRSVEHQ